MMKRHEARPLVPPGDGGVARNALPSVHAEVTIR